MKGGSLRVWLAVGLLALGFHPGEAAGQQGTWCLVIHGGAGVMEREKMPPERQQAYLLDLDRVFDGMKQYLAPVDAIAPLDHHLLDGFFA